MHEKLLEEIRKYAPVNEQEQRDREILLQEIAVKEDIFLRSSHLAHMTASGWVVNKEHTKVLMAYHNIYDSWAWLGGHADGEEDLLAVAMKEVKEESGLTGITPVSRDIASLEILTVAGHEKRGRYVSSHLHYNVTYLLEAEETQHLQYKPDENQAVAWFTPEEAIAHSTEEWFCARIYPKLIRKM